MPVGKGHVVLFANNPIWRGETIGSYFLVFNAILNLDSLNAGRKLDPRVTAGRRSAGRRSAGLQIRETPPWTDALHDLARRGRSLDAVVGAAGAEAQPAAQGDRALWVGVMQKLADPVLNNLAGETLKQRMPVEQAAGANREGVTHLEALGRLIAGIAPWLELPATHPPKGRSGHATAALARGGDRPRRRSGVAGLSQLHS